MRESGWLAGGCEKYFLVVPERARWRGEKEETLVSDVSAGHISNECFLGLGTKTGLAGQFTHCGNA